MIMSDAWRSSISGDHSLPSAAPIPLDLARVPERAEIAPRPGQHERDPLPPVQPPLGDERRGDEERGGHAYLLQDRQRDVMARPVAIVERDHHRVLRASAAL